MKSIKKASIVVAAILALIIGIAFTSFAANSGTVIEEADLRKTASNSSIVLEIIPKKEEVEILTEKDGWYEVRYNKIRGYVEKDFIRLEEDTTDDTEVTQIKEINKGDTFIIARETMLYIRPLINSTTIKTLEKDTKVNIVEIRNNWVYITINDVSGWINLNSINAVIASKEENNIEDAKIAYISGNGVNFREEANLDSTILKVFAQNTKIVILEEDGDWYKIRYNDQIGYVVKTYVSEKKVETTSRSNIDRTSKNEITNQETVSKEATNNAPSVEGAKIAEYVKQFVGYKYVYGGSTPSGGFDCSGLTMYVYSKFGVSLPHSATSQSKLGTKVARADLQPGDLVFFTDYKTNEGIGHVGIYIGDNQFVHASTEKTGVKTSSITGSYSSRYVTAVRFF